MGSKDEDVVKYFWKKYSFYLCPTGFESYVVSYCSKFAVKVDFSSGGCQKLPNWVKVTDQNADLLQLVRKIFYSKSWRKKSYNLFYSIMQLKMHLHIAKPPFFHFHLTTKSSNGTVSSYTFWTPTGNSNFRPSLFITFYVIPLQLQK